MQITEIYLTILVKRLNKLREKKKRMSKEKTSTKRDESTTSKSHRMKNTITELNKLDAAKEKKNQ